MKQKHKDRFRQLFKEYSEDDFHRRSERAARHLLAAAAFKNHSRVCFEQTDSVLLPPVGYYYSCFHMAVALCFLNPQVREEKLDRIRHTQLQKIITSHFVDRRLLSDSFSKLLDQQKKQREFLNYTFGEFGYDLFREVAKTEKRINQQFVKCFKLIDKICEVAAMDYDIRFRIGVYIADAKGDDFVQTYLSESEQDDVIEYLVEAGYCV